MTRRALLPCRSVQDLWREHAEESPPVLLRLFLCAALLIAAMVFAAPVPAAVDLRVEAAPVSAPIQAFVTVTDANGNPVPGLNLSDFTVRIDGTTMTPSTFTLPPNQDPTQKVSVVFAMDYSGSVTTAALPAMQAAVTDFINAMNDGDFAAIVKFSGTAGASVVQEFTEINDAAKTQLINVVMTDYPSGRTNLLDALNLSINQFVTPPVPLPPGPKAIIAVTDGGDNASQIVEGVVHDNAAANSIPIFTIGVSTIIRPELLTRLAAQSGGEYLPAPTPAAIADAYVTISELLNNEYLLTITSSITDCNQHTLEVTVTGQAAASTAFVRCGAAPPPPPPPAPPRSGGGGGGAVGIVALLGLLGLVARRRQGPRGQLG